jgi:hypothetical protein
MLYMSCSLIEIKGVGRMKKTTALFIIGILCLSMFGVFLPKAKAQTNLIVNPSLVFITSTTSPTVSVSPSSWTMDVGQSTTFSATASGGSGIYSYYMWYVNGLLAEKQYGTTSTMPFTPGYLSSPIGTYLITATVNDSSGTTSVQSPAATVTVNASPTVSVAPGSATLNAGQIQTFTATANGGSGTIHYQWYLDGTTVGSDSSLYSYTAAGMSHSITCEITDSASTPVTSPDSNTVSVMVNQLTPTPSPTPTQTPATTSTPTPTFVFSVSITGAAFSVNQGGSANVPVQVNLVSGKPGPVSLGIAWIPPGSNQWFTTSFSESSGELPLKSTLSITALGNARSGSYLVQILATGGGNVESTTATVIVGAQVLFSDDFAYAEENGYVTSGNWINQQWPDSNYGLVSSSNSNIVMNVPQGTTLQNKVETSDKFNGEALDVFVQFKIVNPQPAPDYAIFLYRQNPDGSHRQELDWEYSASKGAGYQQITSYYNTAPPLGGQMVSLPAPWDEITTYSEWTTLEFELRPNQVRILINGNIVAGPFTVGSSAGGFDATDFQLFLETTDNVYTSQMASQDSSLLVESVQIITPNILAEAIHSPANLLVKDPQGRLVGFDPRTGEVVNQIPYASYSGLGSEPQTVIIPDPINGTYETTLLGTASGKYSLTIEYADSTQATTQTFNGTISLKQTLGFSAAISGTGILTAVPEFPAQLIVIALVFLMIIFLSVVAIAKKKVKWKIHDE